MKNRNDTVNSVTGATAVNSVTGDTPKKFDETKYALYNMKTKGITDPNKKRAIMSQVTKEFSKSEYEKMNDDAKKARIEEIIDNNNSSTGGRRSKRRSNKSRVYKKGSQKK